jgi:poly(A) polymerase
VVCHFTPLTSFKLTPCAGADIVDKVIIGTAQWSELFSKHDFFHKYRYYLQITASAGDAELQMKWFVEVLGRVDLG